MNNKPENSTSGNNTVGSGTTKKLLRRCPIIVNRIEDYEAVRNISRKWKNNE